MKTLRNIILGLTLAGAATIGMAADKEEVEAPPPRRNITTMTEIFSDLSLGEVDSLDTRQQYTSIYLDYEYEPGRTVPAIAHLIFQNAPPYDELGRGDTCNISIYSLPQEERMFEMTDYACDGYNYHADSFYDFRSGIQAGLGSTEEKLARAYDRETLVLSSVKKAKKKNKISERMAARKEIFDKLPKVENKSADKTKILKKGTFEFPMEDETESVRPVEAEVIVRDYAPNGLFEGYDNLGIRLEWKDTSKAFLGLQTSFSSNFSDDYGILQDLSLNYNVNKDSSVEDKFKAIDREMQVYNLILDALN